MKKSVAITIIAILAVIAVALGGLYYTSNETKNGQIAALEGDKAALSEQVTSLEGDKAALGEQVAALEGDKAALGEQVAALEGDKAALGEQVAALEGDKAALGEQVAALEGDKAALGEQVVALEGDKAALGEQIAALEGDKAALGEQIVALEGDRAALGEQVAALTAELEALRAQQAEAQTSKVTGTWYANEVTVNGISLHPSILDVELTVEINADGTVALNSNFNQMGGKWSAEGEDYQIINDDGNTFCFRLEEGNLIIYDEEGQLTCGREPVAPVMVVHAQARTDASPEEYEGLWNATHVDMMGMQLEVTSLDMSVVLRVENGRAVLSDGEREDAYLAAMEDGVMILTSEELQETLTLQLLVDGTLWLDAEPEEGVDVNFFFERVVE